MTLLFLIFAAFTVAGAAAAMTLRNPVHCVLALTLGLAGLATLYLQLDAQFVGFTQVLVYVGAVAILAVFAIMMTHGPTPQSASAFSPHWLSGGSVAAGVFAVLAWVIHSRTIGTTAASITPAPLPPPAVSVEQIGDALIHRYVLPLELIGLLLTAALIGAVVLAMSEKGPAR